MDNKDRDRRKLLLLTNNLVLFQIMDLFTYCYFRLPLSKAIEWFLT